MSSMYISYDIIMFSHVLLEIREQLEEHDEHDEHDVPYPFYSRST